MKTRVLHAYIIDYMHAWESIFLHVLIFVLALFILYFTGLLQYVTTVFDSTKNPKTFNCGMITVLVGLLGRSFYLACALL